ncbi:condensation domain-containing protein [Mycobacterium paragordonae]|uniref:condensation domain-containing protein n=1 Tax=Mycobacterium paragordonae TaxID=1389713 RepID=UPI0010CF3C2A|nr:hypothetical protein EUA05_31650 [Mycobacterium paragordonae]
MIKPARMITLRPSQPWPCTRPLRHRRFSRHRSPSDVKRLVVACDAEASRFGTQCARLSLVDGEPVFIVDRQLPQKLQSLRCIDLRAEPDPVEAAHRWMNDNYHRPIDLFGDQLTDLALLRITDNLSYFYLRAHHVLFDGYGAYNFIRHIAAAYSGSVGGHHRRQLLRMP